MVSGYCPFCEAYTNVVDAPLVNRTDLKKYKHPSIYTGLIYIKNAHEWAFLGKCCRCDNAIMVVSDSPDLRFGGAPRHKTYPEMLKSSFEMNGVPEIILQSARESFSCFENGEYKSSAIMARRTIEELCIEQGATEYKLMDKIKNLSHLTPAIKSMLDAIRLVGNDGAHISATRNEIKKNKLSKAKNISEDDAGDLLKLMKILLQTVYQAAAISKTIHSKRTKVKKIKKPKNISNIKSTTNEKTSTNDQT